jgi:hypothetical protein
MWWRTHGPGWPGGLIPFGHRWPDDLTAISTAATAIILAITAIVIWRQLREAESTRYAALAADLTRRWDEPLLSSSRREVLPLSPEELRDIIKSAYEGTPVDPSELERFYLLQAVPNFIEAIAAIEHGLGGLSIEFVDRLWGGAIIRTWQKWSLAVEYVQAQPGAERAFKNFEWLATRIAWRRGVEL